MKKSGFEYHIIIFHKVIYSVLKYIFHIRMTNNDFRPKEYHAPYDVNPQVF